MSYTATKFINPRAFPFPNGFDNTQKSDIRRGNFVENDTATEYSTGGIGSSSFEVTAFSAVGLVTYSNLLGAPLVNGQRVVVFNTATNTNDGTFIVSQLTPSSASAGTFVAVPLPGNALSGSAQTSQTAEGVGQIQWAARNFLPQTFTVTACVVTGGVAKITYTTLTGPQLTPGDNVTLAMGNALNSGTFSISTATPTSSTAGSFTIQNPFGVSTDTGTGTGQFKSGLDCPSGNEVPTQVNIFSPLG